MSARGVCSDLRHYPKTPRACSLVCKAWVSPSYYHLFSSLEFTKGQTRSIRTLEQSFSCHPAESVQFGPDPRYRAGAREDFASLAEPFVVFNKVRDLTINWMYLYRLMPRETYFSQLGRFAEIPYAYPIKPTTSDESNISRSCYFRALHMSVPKPGRSEGRAKLRGFARGTTRDTRIFKHTKTR